MVKNMKDSKSMNFKDVRNIFGEIYHEDRGADQRTLRFFKHFNATFFLYDGTPLKAYAVLKNYSVYSEIWFYSFEMKAVRVYRVKDFDFGFDKHAVRAGIIKHNGESEIE